MRWVDALRPARMQRIAIVAPEDRLRDVLVQVAGSGAVEIDPRLLELHGALEGAGPGRADRPSGPPVPAEAPTPEATGMAPRVLPRAPRVDDLEAAGRWDLVAGERELGRVGEAAVRHRGAAILLGWTPRSRVAELAARMTPHGTSVAELPNPPGMEVPTLTPDTRLSRPFRGLVETYGTVPYADIDPAIFAGVTYAVMFGMMFGDVGHGLILAGMGLVLRRSRRPALASFRSSWAIVTGAGLTAAAFGALFGECFGPTGLVPPVWLRPTEKPIELITAGIILGGGFLAASFVIGMVNRWREGGPLRALYASSGMAGASLYLGGGAVVGGVLAGIQVLTTIGTAVAVVGVALLFLGFLAASGGGFGGAAEALIEALDAVIRTISNAVSFARLAAFGLTHAAIGGLVWAGTTGLWSGGGFGPVAAVALFCVGNVVAFALEALVAAVQALRLEYYELFSRIFAGEGRAFAPWHLAIAQEEEP